MLGRDLVITVKLAQFLTDGAQSGTSRFRMLPGVSWAKKIEKWGEQKFKTRTGGHELGSWPWGGEESWRDTRPAMVWYPSCYDVIL